MDALPMLDAIPVGARDLRFTLRDDNQQHYHRCVPMAQSPLVVRLAWRASAEAGIHPIGQFQLDLPVLLRLGYIRLEQPGDPSRVRVRFFRAGDGMIYLQSRAGAARLAVARAPSQS